MPGNFSRVRLYADRRWKVYSNNKTERMQALPAPLGSPAAGLLGLQKGRYPNESSCRPCQPHIPRSRCLHAPHLCCVGNSALS